MHSHLSICIFLESEPLAQALKQGLRDDRYAVTVLDSDEAFFIYIEQEKSQLDCLVLQDSPKLPPIANWLHGQAVLLPAVIISTETTIPEDHSKPPQKFPVAHALSSVFTYHTAEVWIAASEMEQLSVYIERSIKQFLNLSPTCQVHASTFIHDLADDSTQNFLTSQQQRLTDKLKERLGYLGVYYKRNPQNFFRHLPPLEKQELLDQLRADYRTIVLRYFAADSSLNQLIDDFVNTVFFADIPVSQVVEIHMDLMDEFSKQLKLEGRSEDILLDYRLTLIDTIAHLCEMYRRSIPRES
ncbi:circadian clock protein KaiA [Kovacikia minuta CCNUW1]|uniref:circadian clock protein KaiA n=1 Tax=Kovacikia minuta TaxID=2931930 RepID=UPI001CCC1BB8|nr:circadian clock protein KaiA [Kovacikia minuta]UBF25485.1 circadian clock protein KaiA [Kovacikia minuta CCNUW1]